MTSFPFINMLCSGLYECSCTCMHQKHLFVVSILVSFHFLPAFDDNRSKCNATSCGAEKNSTKTSRWLKFDEFEKLGMSCTLLENVQFYTKLMVVGQAASATSSYLVRLLIKVPSHLKNQISHSK